MNLQQFTVTNTGQSISFSAGDQTLSIPILILSAIVCGDNGEFLMDCTGDNALVFPHFFTKIPFDSPDGLSLSGFLKDYSPNLFAYQLQLGNQ